MTGIKIKMAERYGIGVTDPRGIFGASNSASTTSIGSLTGLQLTALEKDVALIKYILQRTIPNYDELVTQFKAIEDIKEAEQWEE